MRLCYRTACAVALVVAVLLSVLRAVGGDLYTSGLWVSGLAIVALFLLCSRKPRKSTAVNGVMAMATSAAALLAGVALIVSTLLDTLDLLDNVYPYPQPLTMTTVNAVLLFVMLFSGIVGGLFFVLTGITWLRERKTTRGQLGGMALFPLVWCWARLIWYMFSFTSAINRFSGMIELAMLVFEMLFLLAFARYVSGIEERPPRFALSFALCAVLFGLTATVTHVVAFLRQDAVLFGNTALLSAPDIGITLLAAVWVAGQVFCKGEVALPLPIEEEPEPEEEQPADEVTVEEDPVEEDRPFLLDEEAFRMADGADDEDEGDLPPEEERRPLELEDILNDIINGKL